MICLDCFEIGDLCFKLFVISVELVKSFLHSESTPMLYNIHYIPDFCPRAVVLRYGTFWKVHKSFYAASLTTIEGL